MVILGSLSRIKSVKGQISSLVMSCSKWRDSRIEGGERESEQLTGFTSLVQRFDPRFGPQNGVRLLVPSEKDHLKCLASECEQVA